MTTAADVKASADKVASIATTVIGDLGKAKTDIADLSAKLQAALAAGADTAQLQEIADELDGVSNDLTAAHANAIAEAAPS